MSGRPDYSDRLADYVDVKERIRLFYERYPDGRLRTSDVRFPHPDDDVQRVTVCALAYRTADDPLPGVGYSWMVLPGTTPYTRGSELENAETSAWGRAIGSLGIGIDKSIASRDEAESKAGEDDRPRPAAGQTAPTPESGLLGAVEKRAEWLGDLLMRETPKGPVIGFRLKQGRQTLKVQAHGPVAIALAAVDLQPGTNVTCWGTLVGEEYTPSGTTRAVTYQTLRLERIKGAEFTIPADDAPTEAASLPLFDTSEQAAIDDALAEVM